MFKRIINKLKHELKLYFPVPSVITLFAIVIIWVTMFAIVDAIKYHNEALEKQSPQEKSIRCINSGGTIITVPEGLFCATGFPITKIEPRTTSH